MSGVMIDRIYYRNTSTYPSGTVDVSSGWNKIPAASNALSGVVIMGGAGNTIEPGTTEKKGNGNTYVETEKATVKVLLKNVLKADYAALRALINVDSDIILVDSKNPTIGYLTHSVIMYPKGTLDSPKGYTVEWNGECERAAGIAAYPHDQIVVSNVA